jgi:hypothetical protein
MESEGRFVVDKIREKLLRVHGARLVREKIGTAIKRAKMSITKVKHKKQMLDVRC